MLDLISIIVPIIVEIIASTISKRKSKEGVRLQLNDIEIDYKNVSPEDIKNLLDNFISDSDIKSMTPIELQRAFMKSIESVNIFLSYCWKDDKLADEIESYFDKTNISVKRDKKNIEQWGSIRKYMDSIRTTDYVILIISEDYLKSMNCMYEVKQLMKDEKYRQRIFPLVLESKIYEIEGRIDYIVYWEKRYAEIKAEIEKIQNPESLSRVAGDLNSIREISYSISEFLDIIQDMNNPSKENLLSSIVDRLVTQTGNTRTLKSNIGGNS